MELFSYICYMKIRLTYKKNVLIFDSEVLSAVARHENTFLENVAKYGIRCYVKTLNEWNRKGSSYLLTNKNLKIELIARAAILLQKHFKSDTINGKPTTRFNADSVNLRIIK